MGAAEALYLEPSQTLPSASLLLDDFNLYPFAVIDHDSEDKFSVGPVSSLQNYLI